MLELLGQLAMVSLQAPLSVSTMRLLLAMQLTRPYALTRSGDATLERVSKDLGKSRGS